MGNTPLHVLIVEDSEDDALMIVKLLQKGGYDLAFELVDNADSMRAALSRNPWDLVISDYRLPAFNGLDALATLQETGHDLPFIIVSGTIGEAIAVKAMKSGAHDYLMKDNLARLVPAVERELKEWRIRQAHEQAEKVILQSEERYRILFENSPETIVLVNLDGIIMDANPAAANILDLPRDAFIGKNVFELGIFSEHDVPNYKNLHAHLASGNSLPPFEITITDSRGNPRSFDIYPALLKRDDKLWAIQFIGRDITELKKGVEALREAHQFNMEVIADAAVGIIVYDQQLHYMMWNPFMEKLTGLYAEDVLGKYVLDVFPQYKQQGIDALLVRALAGETVTSLDISYQIPQTGKSGWVSGVYAPHYNAEGDITGVIELVYDTTERIQAEKFREELEVLRELDQLKSELIGNVSHELRTPLGLILVMATALQDKEINQSVVIRDTFLKDIEEEARKLEKIVDNLLDTSRLQRGRIYLERDAVDLHPVIIKTVERISTLDQSHRFQYDPPEEKIIIAIDETRIEQVLYNLLDNAVKYSPTDTTISIQVYQEGANVCVKVSDEGPGIPIPDRERVFERFYRIVNADQMPRPGLGLGLSIARGIVEAHGGRIWIEDRPGGGGVFVFSIPAN